MGVVKNPGSCLTLWGETRGGGFPHRTAEHGTLNNVGHETLPLGNPPLARDVFENLVKFSCPNAYLLRPSFLGVAVV